MEEDIFSNVRQTTSYALGSDGIESVMESLISTLNEEGNRVLKEQEDIICSKVSAIKKRMVTGRFVEETLKFIADNNIDLVIMDHDRNVLGEDDLFHLSPCPIWIEKGGDVKRIVMVSTNLAPNRRVPVIASRLSRTFEAKTLGLYVIDRPSGADTNSLEEEAKEFTKNLSDSEVFPDGRLKIQTTSGKLSKVVVKSAGDFKADLIILGRIRRPKRIIQLSNKNMKQSLAFSLPYNLLLIN